MMSFRSVAAIALALALLGFAGASPARVQADNSITVNGPNGIALTVTPAVSGNLATEVALQVSGTGYSTTKNGGNGVYISFGPQPTGPRLGNSAFTDANRYYNGGAGHGTMWVHPGTPGGPNQAELLSDGTFSFTLYGKASYTGADTNTYDSATQQLGVLTYAAHGLEATAADADSQYVFAPITFASPPAAPGAPTASASSSTAADVSWTEPASGGAPITGYTVTIYNGVSASSVAATSTVGNVSNTSVGGLNPDSSYTAKVAATNGAGTGSQSPASPVFRTPPTAVGPTQSGLTWKISHQAWTSSSLNTHELVAPATKTADGFVFPPSAEGTYNPKTGAAHADFLGTASIGNVNQGGYRIYFANPSIDVDGAGAGTLSADVSYRTSLAGPVSTPVRVDVANFDVDPQDVQNGADHVVVEAVLAATFDADFIASLAETLRGHFQATGSGSDPLKPPSPLSAGFDHADQPLASLAPANHDFGSVAVGSNSATFEFSVTNSGLADLNQGTVSLRGADSGQFEITANSCTDDVLAATESCSISVRFAPSATGAKGATLEVPSDELPTLSAGVSGTGGVPAPATIRIVQDSVPNHATDFSFSGDLGTFSLDDDGNAALPRQASFSVAPGTYVVTQAPVAGWGLVALTCSSGGSANLSTRTATIVVNSGAVVTCTFKDATRKVDAKIAKGSGPWKGNNVYSTTPVAGQTVAIAVPRSKSKTLKLRFQNDGSAKDSVTIDADLAGSSLFTVTFRKAGVDITNAVVAGTYVVTDIKPGSQVTIQVTITAANSTPASATRQIDVRATSTGSNTAVDVVRANVTRK